MAPDRFRFDAWPIFGFRFGDAAVYSGEEFGVKVAELNLC
jgi:hypothetical protein